MIIYQVYFIQNKPGVGKYVGCTKNLASRMQNHGVSLKEVDILFQSEDIIEASYAEQQYQKIIIGKADGRYYHLISFEKHNEAIADALRGVPLSESRRQRMSVAAQDVPKSESHRESMRKPKSESHRKAISDGKKSIPKKECPHCHRMFEPAMLARWHGDHCKLKEIENAVC